MATSNDNPVLNNAYEEPKYYYESDINGKDTEVPDPFYVDTEVPDPLCPRNKIIFLFAE